MKDEIKKGLNTSLENCMWNNYIVLFSVCVSDLESQHGLACLLCCSLVLIKIEGNKTVTEHMHVQGLAAFGR